MILYIICESEVGQDFPYLFLPKATSATIHAEDIVQVESLVRTENLFKDNASVLK